MNPNRLGSRGHGDDLFSRKTSACLFFYAAIKRYISAHENSRSLAVTTCNTGADTDKHPLTGNSDIRGNEITDFKIHFDSKCLLWTKDLKQKKKWVARLKTDWGNALEHLRYFAVCPDGRPPLGPSKAGRVFSAVKLASSSCFPLVPSNCNFSWKKMPSEHSAHLFNIKCILYLGAKEAKRTHQKFLFKHTSTCVAKC